MTVKFKYRAVIRAPHLTYVSASATNREIAQVNYSSNDALNQPADCAGNCDIIAQL